MKFKKSLTLIEIIVSIAVIVISLLGAAALFTMSMRMTRESKIRFNSAILAKDLMEEISTKKWDELSSPSIVLGPEFGESRAGSTELTYWDDIDDYNGLSNNPPQAIDGTVMNGSNHPYPNYSNYRRSVTVRYVDDTTLQPAAFQTNYKRIRIRVDYSHSKNFADPDHTFNLDQVMTNTR
ncbi:MAG: hypothetical protein JW867_03480 [Candidatus Omnitrophica bacterium]|nr:hypothetical protein [Candidatus Omnitrophota bacterium]